jgi:predicted PurR-regulated permease PerM
MLAIDRRAARAVWTAIVILLGVWLVWLARTTIVLFSLSLLFAYLLTPVLRFVHRFTPGRVSPEVSLAIVYLLLVAIITSAGIAVGSRIGEEASNLAAKLPALVQDPQWENHIPLPQWLEPHRASVIAFLRSEVLTGGRDIVPYLQRMAEQLVLGVRYVGYLVLVPVLAFFFLKDGERLLARILKQVAHGPARASAEEILADIDRVLGQYMRALVFQSLSAFLCYSLFLTFTGAPYAILLSAIAGPLEFLPVIGPLTAGVLTAFVTGIAGYAHIVWFVVFWVLLRGFQDYLLIPFLLGAGIEMNPLLILFGVLAGEQVAGVAGMFFSVPIIAISTVVIGRLRANGNQPARPGLRMPPDSVE